MSEVREKRGLTYGVYSGFSPMQVRGPFMINLQTRAEMSGGTLRLVEDVLADYLKTGPTQKNWMTPSAAGRQLPAVHRQQCRYRRTVGRHGFLQPAAELSGRFHEQSQALTVDQVKAAMNKHLSADKMVIVTAGPTIAQKPLPPPLINLPSSRSGFRSINGQFISPEKPVHNVHNGVANCASLAVNGAAAS